MLAFSELQKGDVPEDDRRLWSDNPESGGYILYTVPSQGRPIEPALVVQASPRAGCTGRPHRRPTAAAARDCTNISP